MKLALNLASETKCGRVCLRQGVILKHSLSTSLFPTRHEYRHQSYLCDGGVSSLHPPPPGASTPALQTCLNEWGKTRAHE